MFPVLSTEERRGSARYLICTEYRKIVILVVSKTSSEVGGCCLAAVSAKSLTESIYNHKPCMFQLVDDCC